MYFASYKFSFFNNQPYSVVGKNKNGIHKFGFIACKSKTTFLHVRAWRRFALGGAKPLPRWRSQCAGLALPTQCAAKQQPITTSKVAEKGKYWKKDNKFFTSDRTSVISRANNNINNFNSNKQLDNKQEVVSITYEEIGLFPRSFSRVLDRFLKQVFSDVENLVIQEYRFYRYLFLTTLKCLLILFFIPFFVNFIAKTYIVRPLTEYFWNTKQTEIFLNSSQQKHAFAELKEFEEKTYFESLIFPKSVFTYNNVDSNLQLPINETNEPGDSVFRVVQSAGLSPLQGKSVNAETVNRSPRVLGSEGYTSVQPSDSRSELLTTPRVLPPGLALVWQSQPPPVSRLGIDSVNAKAPTLGNPEGAARSAAKPEGTSERQSPPFPKGAVALHVRASAYRDEQPTPTSRSPYEATGLFIYETQEADKNLQQRYQEKTIELAQRYNDQSVEAITNIFADLISLLTLFYLLYALEIQINITKSFLLEVFFGLDDSKKSLLILLVTDLLVGYHSSNLWELFFEFLFHHYGLPESQTGVFLLVATLPVLLDVLFKYLIFRHLNRSSPATVATYHAMIE